MTSTPELLLPKVAFAPSGCWIWTAGISTVGYGVLWLDGRQQLAHRLSYKAFVGSIPDGLQIDHLCRVRRCICPDHLDAVTCRTNLLRGHTRAAANARKTHCVRGHEYAGDNLAFAKSGSRVCKACRRFYNDVRRGKAVAA